MSEGMARLTHVNVSVTWIWMSASAVFFRAFCWSQVFSTRWSEQAISCYRWWSFTSSIFWRTKNKHFDQFIFLHSSRKLFYLNGEHLLGVFEFCRDCNFELASRNCFANSSFRLRSTMSSRDDILRICFKSSSFFFRSMMSSCVSWVFDLISDGHRTGCWNIDADDGLTDGSGCSSSWNIFHTSNNGSMKDSVSRVAYLNQIIKISAETDKISNIALSQFMPLFTAFRQWSSASSIVQCHTQREHVRFE